MIELQKRELARAVKLIEMLGCKYKVISPDGEEFGGLTVVIPKPPRPKRNLRLPYGTVAEYYKPFIDVNLNVGEVIEIPKGNFKVELLRSGICSYLTRVWGNKTYVTMMTKDTVQVMRTATAEQKDDQ